MRMDIKKRIEQNPIICLLISAISVSAVVLSVAEYFCRQRIDIASQKSELRINTLESELTSIRRGMGESNFLDIRTFVYPKDRLALLKVNPKSKYVSEENFYAILDLPGWQYESISTEQFIRNELGVEMPPTFKKLLGKSPVYTWTATEHSAIKGPYDYTESGPSIVIERLRYAPLLSASNQDYAAFLKESSGIEIKPEEIPDLADRGINQDKMATLQLASFMQSNCRQFADPDFDTRLVELEKVGNVIYLQMFITIQNGTVNGRKLPIFFVRHEVIIITDQNGATQIIITVPSADPTPRGPVYAQIQEWFSGLAIPVS
jgi:hypothetical protein